MLRYTSRNDDPHTHYVWTFSWTTDVTVDFHLFTSNSKIRCWPKITCYINILYKLYSSRNSWNSTVNRWPRSTIRSVEPVMPDWGTNPAKGLFFACFEYIRDSPTPRQSGITVWSNSHTPTSISEVPSDFDIISVYDGAVSFLNHITRELANFLQPNDKLWDIHNKLICYILYTSKEAYW